MARNRISVGVILFAAILLGCIDESAADTIQIDACCHSPDLSDAKLQQLIANARSGRAGDLAYVASTLDLRGDKANAVAWHRKAAMAPDGFARAFSDYALAIRTKNYADYVKYLRLAVALDNEAAWLHTVDPGSKFPLTAEDARFWMQLRGVESGESGIFGFCESLRKTNRDDLIIGMIFRGDKSYSKWPASLKSQYRECRPGLVQSIREKRLLRSAVREATLTDPGNPNLMEPALWEGQ